MAAERELALRETRCAGEEQLGASEAEALADFATE